MRVHQLSDIVRMGGRQEVTTPSMPRSVAPGMCAATNSAIRIIAGWPFKPRITSVGAAIVPYSANAGAATQNPWRNATMHLDQKYTEQGAKDICDVVRAFMSRLAGCDENGLPLA